MKKTVILLTYLLLSLSGQAQSLERMETFYDINTIKRDTSFIYAESTMKDAHEAQSGAQAILELKLYDWLRIKHPKEDADSLVSRSKGHWHRMFALRGKYNRIFVYVRKWDVLPVVDVPMPVVADTASVKEKVLPPVLTTDEETMAAIIRFESIEPYVNGLKNDGRLQAYGKYATLPKEDPCYMFVYDREGSVVAVLRQDTGGAHLNLRTLATDHVRNYKNCGAIWLQLK